MGGYLSFYAASTGWRETTTLGMHAGGAAWEGLLGVVVFSVLGAACRGSVGALLGGGVAGPRRHGVGARWGLRGYLTSGGASSAPTERRSRKRGDSPRARSSQMKDYKRPTTESCDGPGLVARLLCRIPSARMSEMVVGLAVREAQANLRRQPACALTLRRQSVQSAISSGGEAVGGRDFNCLRG